MNPMEAITGKAADVRNVLDRLRSWPDHLSDRPAKTPSSRPSTHIGLRIWKKIEQFDRKIAKFPQRKWS
jgi:hypothetical protein